MSQPSSEANLVCTRCGFMIPPGEVSVAGDEALCAGCAGRRARASDGISGAQRFPIALAAGALGALLGAGVWAGIAVVTGREMGIIALLIGFLAGLGVTMGAGGAKGRHLQLASASLASGGLVLAKYLTFAHFFAEALAAQGRKVGTFDPAILSAFPAAMVERFDPMDLLWIFLALSTAWSTPADAMTKKSRPERGAV